MLACEWKPTRQPSRSSATATVTTTIALSIVATRSSKARHARRPCARRASELTPRSTVRVRPDPTCAPCHARRRGGTTHRSERRTSPAAAGLLLGSAAAAVAFMAGCSSDDAGGAHDRRPGADDGTTARPPPSTSPAIRSRWAWRRVTRCRTPSSSGPGWRRSRSAARRPRRDARRARWTCVGGGQRRRLRRRRADRRRRRRARATPTRCTSTSTASSRPPTTTTGSPSASTRARWRARGRFPTGRPSASASRVVNCQWFETGAYAAYRHLLDEDVDLVVHLGDYIYEYPGGARRRARPRCRPTRSRALTDYRLRYASYQLDEDLRNAHHRFPFVLTWDDHEVANNYSGDELRSRRARPRRPGPARRPPTRRGGSTCRCGSGRPTTASSSSTSTSTSATSPASTCSTSGSSATSPPCRDGDPRPTTSATAPSALDDRTLPGRRAGGLVRRRERRQHRHVEPDRQPRGARPGSTAATTPTAPPTTSTPGTATPRRGTASSSSWPPSTTPSSSPATTTPGCCIDVHERPFEQDSARGGARADGAADLVTAVPRRHHRPQPAGAGADQRPRLPRRRGHPDRCTRVVPGARRRRRPAPAPSPPGSPARSPPAPPRPRSTPDHAVSALPPAPSDQPRNLGGRCWTNARLVHVNGGGGQQRGGCRRATGRGRGRTRGARRGLEGAEHVERAQLLGRGRGRRAAAWRSLERLPEVAGVAGEHGSAVLVRTRSDWWPAVWPGVGTHTTVPSPNRSCSPSTRRTSWPVSKSAAR